MDKLFEIDDLHQTLGLCCRECGGLRLTLIDHTAESVKFRDYNNALQVMKPSVEQQPFTGLCYYHHKKREGRFVENEDNEYLGNRDIWLVRVDKQNKRKGIFG